MPPSTSSTSAAGASSDRETPGAARPGAPRGGARLLVPGAALLWGLQFALLVPSLALLLVALYDASPAEVGWAVAIYNAAGFIAALVIPAWADRRGDYLVPLLGCGAATIALAGALAAATTLPWAVVALVVLGAPAGVGVSLLFAHLRHSGAGSEQVVNVRAVVSFAWIAGPPLATFVIGAFGSRAVLVVLGIVAVLNVVTTAGLLAARRASRHAGTAGGAVHDDAIAVSRVGVVLIVVAFVALQATNNSVVSVMALFVTRDLGLPVVWAGIALGVAAAVEVPALLVLGRLSRRFSDLTLIVSGCLAGVAYYVGMALVAGPVALVAMQVVNAWFFAVVAGTGLALFQRVIPRPGLASGLYANTRRLGGIVSGPIIVLGVTAAWGYAGIFWICAVMTAAAVVVISLVARSSKQTATSFPAAR